MGSDTLCPNFTQQQEEYQNKPECTKRAQKLLIIRSKCGLSAAKYTSCVCLCIRLTENGVQGEQLARDLLSVSALPAADRNQVLHPQR